MIVLTEYGLAAAERVEKKEVGNNLENIVNMVGRIDDREKV